MGVKDDVQKVGPLPVGPTGTRLVQADGLFEEVTNFVPSEEGGLVVCTRPLEYVHAAAGGPPSNGTPSPSLPRYGTTYGIFHCRIREGQRDVLLLQTGQEIWEFYGWTRRWNRLIAAPFAEAVSYVPVPNTTDFPTQFVSTPTGVIIIPPGGRAHFYDGRICLPLGYDRAPGPPIGYGPESSANQWAPDLLNSPFLGVNDTGYAMDSIDNQPSSFMFPLWRQGRVGTVDTPGNVSVLAQGGSEDSKAQVMGYLLQGRYRLRYQWIDLWGNFSPLSQQSNDIRFKRQPAMKVSDFALGPPYSVAWVHVDKVLKQIAWDAIQPGPTGTIGRQCGRTKDLENSGTSEFFVLPSDSAAVEGKFATLPDNVTTTFPDNIPDAWLYPGLVDAIPIPQFRLAALAFGRLFMANAPSQEGTLWFSMVGRYGTVEKFSVIVPDPSAAEILGLHTVNRGLLVFTERSVFLITDNDAGDGFRVEPISTTVGCVAPSSIVTMRNGVTIWLGSDGFYGYDGREVTFLSQAHRQKVRRHNRALLRKAVACFDLQYGEYRCWVAINGSDDNNLCWVYDGADWRFRTDVRASGACVTADHRRMCIVSGKFGGNHGVWVLDHGSGSSDGTLVTGWFHSTRSDERATVKRVWLHLRETGVPPLATDKITVRARVDYRAEFVSNALVNLYPEIKGVTPAVWDTAVLGAEGNKWRRRRPFWAVADIDVQSCESFQLEITSTKRFEILELAFGEQQRPAGGAMAYR